MFDMNSTTDDSNGSALAAIAGGGGGDYPPNYCLVQHLIYHTYTEERALLPASLWNFSMTCL